MRRMPALSGTLLHCRRPEAQRTKLVEPEDRMLTATEGHECRLLLGLVEKAPVFFVFSTRLWHSHDVAGQIATRLQHPATNHLGRCGPNRYGEKVPEFEGALRISAGLALDPG
jgi:hypothetical protein